MKILMITANFAPRGASPAIRTVHFAKYLDFFMNSVDVITYKEDALTLFSPYDETLSKKVKGNIKIHHIKPGILRRRMISQSKKNNHSIQKAKENAKISIFISFLIPDPHIDAIFNFLKRSSKILKRNKYDAIITFGYPFTIHIIGYILKKLNPSIKWITDYGDPWSEAPTSELPRPLWRKKLDYRIERKILKKTDAVFVTTYPTKELYIRLFPGIQNRIHVIPMGYDPQDFNAAKLISRSEDEQNKLWLVHTGRLYSEARDPEPFIKAMEELLKNDPHISKKLSIYLVGEIEKNLKNTIIQSSANSLFNFVPWVPVQESISWMKSADMLLLFGNKGEIQVPGKLYQYFGAMRPIFMIYESLKDPTLTILNKVGNIEPIPNKAEKIKDALHQILLDKNKFFVLKNKISSNKNYYSWLNIVKNVNDIFLKLNSN